MDRFGKTTRVFCLGDDQPRDDLPERSWLVGDLPQLNNQQTAYPEWTGGSRAQSNVRVNAECAVRG